MPSTSKAQQRLMGQAYAVKTGELDPKDIDIEYRDMIVKLSKNMEEKDLKSFAKTKHKNLPERIPESLSDFMNENNPTATTNSVNGMGDVKLPQGDIAGSGDIPHQLTGATAEDDTVEESYKEGADLFVKELEKSNLLKGTNLKVSEGPSQYGAPGEARFRDHVTIKGIGTMTELYIIPRGSVGQYELYTDKSYQSGREIKVGDAKTIIKSMKRYINKMSKEAVNEAKYKVGDKIKYSIPYYDEPKDGEGVIKTVHKDGEKYSLEGGGVIYPNEIKGIAESSSEYFKLFEEFRINEESKMKRHIAGVSKKLKDFFSAVGNESKETAQVVKLLYKANKEDRDLTKAEKDQVKNQLKDVLKTIGLGSLAIMPGGFIVAVILKALKLNDKIIPSSFKKK